MSPGPDEDLAILERCWELASRVGSSASDQLAFELAREFLGLWPEASLVACLLPNGARPAVAICRPEETQPGRPLLPQGRPFQEVLAGVPLPPGHSLQIERMTTGQGEEAALAVALPGEREETRVRARRLLALGCRAIHVIVGNVLAGMRKCWVARALEGRSCRFLMAGIDAAF